MTLPRLRSSLVRLLPAPGDRRRRPPRRGLRGRARSARPARAAARPPRRRRRRRSPSTPVKPTDPFSFLSWLFTPIFQAFFILLVVLDKLTGNIAIAIILMTIIIRIILIPVFRRQTVSTRRTQMLAPEVKEIQRRFKGDRLKQQEAQRQLYAERGINPAAGCLPAILQIFLLIPMYRCSARGSRTTTRRRCSTCSGSGSSTSSARPRRSSTPLGHVLNPCLDPTAFGDQLGRAGGHHRDGRLDAVRPQPAGGHLVAVPAGPVADDPAGPRPGDGRRPATTRSSARWPTSSRSSR